MINAYNLNEMQYNKGIELSTTKLFIKKSTLFPIIVLQPLPQNFKHIIQVF